MRIRLPLGLAGLALTLPVAAAVAEQPAAPVRPTHPARVVQLWQTGDARLGSTSADNSIFEDAVTGRRQVASADHKAPRSAANARVAGSADGPDDQPVAEDSSHTGAKVAVGAAGALGLLFFVDAVSGGNNSSSLTPTDNPPGGGGNVNTPDGGGTGTVVDNSNPGGNVNPPTNPPTSILVDQPSTPETTTPEPVSMTLIGTGLVGLGGMSLRRRRDS
jgi:hypothetical protein